MRNRGLTEEDIETIEQIMALRREAEIYYRIPDSQTRAAILDTIHHDRAGRPSKFVVEGAKVVCTSMMKVKTDGDGNVYTDGDGNAEQTTSGSLMTKLDNATRGARVSEIMSQLSEPLGGYSPGELMGMSFGEVVGGRIENPSSSDIVNAVGHSDNYLLKRYTMNSAILLDHLDIEFYPLFGQEPGEGVDMTNPDDRREAARDKADEIADYRREADEADEEENEEENEEEEDMCDECMFSDDGKCKPYIEREMWLDRDDDVKAAGVSTLLKDNAYMFCHHGQGILYIEQSGQHHPDVIMKKAGIEWLPVPEYFDSTDSFFGEINRERYQITQIIMHHTGEYVHNSAHPHHGGVWCANNIPTGGYNELILRDGRVQILHAPRTAVNGVEWTSRVVEDENRNPILDEHGNPQANFEGRPENSTAYHISLVGLGPDHAEGADFTDIQRRAFVARVRYWMSELGIPLERVRGHSQIGDGNPGCPGIDMDHVRTSEEWLG